jgi:GT2 family glycosyltransferase
VAPRGGIRETGMKLSLVIPTKDNPACLRKLLESIQAVRPKEINLEVLVMDDGSEPPLQVLCEEYGAQWSRIKPSKGPAHNRNRSSNLATGDVLIFLDDDVILPPGFFEAITDVFNESDDVGAVSFINQRYNDHDNAVANYGAVLEHFWFAQTFDDSDAPTAAVRGFTTRNGAVRKTAFDAIHGFDESFKTNAHEDYDFGKRLAAYTHTVLAREPWVYHRFPSSLRRLMRNYWVRTTLFVPYMLKHKPKLDKMQASPAEGRLRLLGAGSLGLIVLGLLPIPGFLFLSAAGLVGLVLYFITLREFLAKALAWSRSPVFVALAALIHLASSVVISAGAAWGLFLYASGRGSNTLISPLDSP